MYWLRWYGAAWSDDRKRLQAFLCLRVVYVVFSLAALVLGFTYMDWDGPYYLSKFALPLTAGLILPFLVDAELDALREYLYPIVLLLNLLLTCLAILDSA